MARPLKVKKISPNDRPEAAARRILRTRVKEFYSHWPDPDRTPSFEQLHNLRISGKRLRYSAESLREFYPDRLALLIDLLKRAQDMLGELQDCVTQRGMIEEQLARMRRRDPQNSQATVLEKLISEYELRQSMLFAQFHEIWRGMVMDEFRESLRAMISRARRPKQAQRTGNQPALRVIASTESFPVDQTGDESGAKAVVNVDDSDI
jgi:hypothetical protein